MKVTAKQVSAYSADKGSTGKCPFCGNDVWFVLTREDSAIGKVDDDEMEIAISSLPVSKSGQSTIPTVSMTCSNCGFIRLQHAELLQEWIDNGDNRR